MDSFENVLESATAWSGSSEATGYSFSGSATGVSWKPLTQIGGEYIQVDLGALRQMDEILIWYTDSNMYIKSFTLWYSSRDAEDATTEHFHMLTDQNGSPYFEGNSDDVASRQHQFYPPVIARHLRLYPTDFQEEIRLNWAVFGCRAGSVNYLSCSQLKSRKNVGFNVISIF